MNYFFKIFRVVLFQLTCLLFCTVVYGQEGLVLERSFMQDDSLRSYLLYVPDAYDGQADWPLVINFHGFNTNSNLQIAFSQMNAVADTAHFLVAYPQGLLVEIPAGFGIGPGWNVPGISSPNDDVAFTDNLIDHVAADFAIDVERIHATGWSNGALMAFYMACVLSDRIASVAGVAASMTDAMFDSCLYQRSVSSLLIHGTADPIVPFDGIPGLTRPVPITPSFLSGQYNCSADSIVTELADISTEDSSTVTLIDYTDCDNNSEILFYRVNNGGHTWPGSNPLPGLEFLGHTNQDIDANSVIWNFFKRNPHPEDVTSVENVHNVPQGFELYVNYPNPFNPITIISYYLPSAASVELTVYNQLGQEIRILENSVQPSGTHQVVWDGRDDRGHSVSSGLYFYRLKAGSFVETRKMLLIR